ncbi:unnamed protein product [Owenia fusiformis]|uniref:Uncharacterized protein n=1 Tax=Owenia fusiformis TaxID=6347 RepID=A0A8J1Y5J3_OWEFU|nr:unnamed protein product [Owenia fusiformis]
MSAFRPAYISKRAPQFTEMIKECEDMGFPKHLLYRSLGTCLVMADPPEEHRLQILNDVWKVVMKLSNPSDYMSCTEVWIEFVVKHFSKKEFNTILGDIIKHLTPDRAFEDHYPQLQSVVSKLLSHMHNFSVLFGLDKFLPLIDMFQRDSVKVEVCKNIMEAFVKFQLQPTNDPVILNALMFICRTMHDSVNALTLEDEVRQIGQLIIGFIKNISFNRDFEQQLSFYVEARAAFSNIDIVLIYLVQSVNKLAMQTRTVVKGNHNRKTSAFVRACAAYCFITIPSLHGVFARLNLYLLSGQTAILNQCLSQGDSFMKAAISLVAEVPKTLELDGKVRSTEPFLIEFLNNFLATLLIVPDSPDQGVLYLLRGLLNVIQDYTWDTSSSAKAVVYTNVLNLLAAYSQESYIYQPNKVDCNDAMYGSDPKFLNEVNKTAAVVLDVILTHLKSMEHIEVHRKQASVSLEVIEHIVCHCDVSKEPMFELAVNLWGLSQRHGQADTKHMVRIMNHVKYKSTIGHNSSDIYSQLVNKLHLQSRT